MVPTGIAAWAGKRGNLATLGTRAAAHNTAGKKRKAFNPASRQAITTITAKTAGAPWALQGDPTGKRASCKKAGVAIAPKAKARPSKPYCPTSSSPRPQGRVPSDCHQFHCPLPTTIFWPTRASAFWSCEIRQVNEPRPTDLNAPT